MVYFYMRISTKEEEEETRYFRQEQILRRYAEEYGYDFIKEDMERPEKEYNVYKDNCSGLYFGGRKAWHMLCRNLRSGDTVVMKDVSRFTMDQRSGCKEYMYLFQELKIRLVFVENPSANTENMERLISEALENRVVFETPSVEAVGLLIYSELDHDIMEYRRVQQKIRDGIASSDKKAGRKPHIFEKLTPELESDIMIFLKDGTGSKLELECKHEVSRPTLLGYISYLQEKMKKNESSAECDKEVAEEAEAEESTELDYGKMKELRYMYDNGIEAEPETEEYNAFMAYKAWADQLKMTGKDMYLKCLSCPGMFRIVGDDMTKYGCEALEECELDCGRAYDECGLESYGYRETLFDYYTS